MKVIAGFDQPDLVGSLLPLPLDGSVAGELDSMSIAQCGLGSGTAPTGVRSNCRGNGFDDLAQFTKFVIAEDGRANDETVSLPLRALVDAEAQCRGRVHERATNDRI